MFNQIRSMSLLALTGIVFMSACSAATPKPAATVAKVSATVATKPTSAPAPTAKPAPTATAVVKPIASPTTAKPAPTAAKPAPTVAPASPVLTDVIGVATSTGTFKTLLSLLQTAGMTDMLRQKGPWTVFAPTDAAFAKLPKGTLDTLLKPANKKKLADILSLHLLSGKDTSADLTKLKALRMSNGASAEITIKDKTMFINDAKITTVDVPATNGIIQVTDTVLLPTMK